NVIPPDVEPGNAFRDVVDLLTQPIRGQVAAIAKDATLAMVTCLNQTHALAGRQHVATESRKSMQIYRCDERRTLIFTEKLLKSARAVADHNRKYFLCDCEDLAALLPWYPVIENSDLFFVRNIALQNHIGLYLSQISLCFGSTRNHPEPRTPLTDIGLQHERVLNRLLPADAMKMFDSMRSRNSDENVPDSHVDGGSAHECTQNVDLRLPNESAISKRRICDHRDYQTAVPNREPYVHCSDREVEHPRRPEFPTAVPLPN